MRISKIILPLTFITLSVTVFTSFKCTGSDLPNGKEIPDKKKTIFQEIVPPPIPSKLSFAGEEVPISNFDVEESLDRELMVNCFFHSQTMRYIKLAPRYFEIIEPILKQNNVPDDFKYLALAESGFDPKAVSPTGASGIWQFMKETGKEYGLEVTTEVDERFHIEKATQAACKYLRSSFSKYKSWTTVAASYNAGLNGVDKQVLRQKETSYYNLMLSEETNRYVFRILALKTILGSPEEYGFVIDPKNKYPSIPFETVKINVPILNLTDFAKTNHTNYKLLKMLNPWLRDTSLKNELKRTYEIKIPTGNLREY